MDDELMFMVDVSCPECGNIFESDDSEYQVCPCCEAEFPLSGLYDEFDDWDDLPWADEEVEV